MKNLSKKLTKFLKDFEESVNNSSVKVIETLGAIMGTGSIKTYAALGATLAFMTPEPPYDHGWHSDGVTTKDDCTMLARFHWFDGGSWQTTNVAPKEVLGEALNAKALMKRQS